MNNNETKDLSELEASLKRRLEKELKELNERLSRLFKELHARNEKVKAEGQERRGKGVIGGEA